MHNPIIARHVVRRPHRHIDTDLLYSQSGPGRYLYHFRPCLSYSQATIFSPWITQPAADSAFEIAAGFLRVFVYHPSPGNHPPRPRQLGREPRNVYVGNACRHRLLSSLSIEKRKLSTAPSCASVMLHMRSELAHTYDHGALNLPGAPSGINLTCRFTQISMERDAWIPAAAGQWEKPLHLESERSGTGKRIWNGIGGCPDTGLLRMAIERLICYTATLGSDLGANCAPLPRR
ncbi:hypothetical protein CERSUDRAFT_123550 [Gelatoporia subvermispora B]|uniref:Uncharacterized protein n=1 Tax=Ceriporiopsis subvermispora (strain B) TaxID=914234 RepID=M2QZK8_CERS8|nr:hypothetical protein CERSUDRAFT_123550 [Gelatoporia subvermispora B]